MRLLAKSVPRDGIAGSVDDAVFLPGHLRECYDAALTILDCTGADQLKALGLEPERWQLRFTRVVSLAAALHDLGKANDHFQGVVQDVPGRSGRLQGLRHEWVTILMLADPTIRGWLSPALGEETTDRLALHCAITGHHPAYGRPSPPQQAAGNGEGTDIHLYLQHPDTVLSLMFVAKTFGLCAPPAMKDAELSLLNGPVSAFSHLHRLFMADQESWDEVGADQKRFVAAVKACLVAADVAGSALPKKLAKREERTAWIERAFASRPTPEQLGVVVRTNLNPNGDGTARRLRPFQEAIAQEAGDVTFVKAGCGSGKTLAAYHWARMRCPGRRLYFCYPTTGTATEGYRDYLFDPESKAGRFGAELFHGRADVDLDIILNADRDTESASTDGAAEDAFARIEALNAWSTPIVSCTVDTVLGIVQNHRRGLYSWPALAGSAFVFDEIHAYDQHLFGALLRFLESVSGVPVLLMTASLPKHRLAAIQERLAKRGTTLTMSRRTDDLRDLEELPRYRCTGDVTARDPLPLILEEAKETGKILWVCNTIDRAMDASARAEAQGRSPIIYHSRFRYEDRVRRHKEVIEAFRANGPVLAVCTQVAEMSLNLSATLLVTDLAPVPALIQRLGRLNRHACRSDPVRPFVVVEPVRQDGKPLLAPYDQETYGDWPTATRQWLAQLPRDSITQADLASQWENLQAEKSEPACERSAWLAGGPTTTVLELRKGSPGLTVIMERDFSDIRTGRKRFSEVALPMPQPPDNLQWKTWDTHKGVPVAPEGTVIYDAKRGARWQKS